MSLADDLVRLGVPNYVASELGASLATGKYTGLVASRCRMPNTSGGANNYSNSRSRHVAMDSVQTVQLVYTNKVATSAGGVETNPGFTTTIKAGIEWPVGTITPVTWSGQSSITLANGDIQVSDPVTLPTAFVIGHVFYVKTYQVSGGTGLVWHQYIGINNATGVVPNSGEWYTASASLIADHSWDTTNSNNSILSTIYYPAAIIGTTARRTVALCGDSRAWGYGEAQQNISNDYGAVGDIERGLSRQFATVNLAIGGDAFVTAISGSNYNVRKQLASYCNTIVSEYGINDFVAGNTAAATIANLYTFAALLGNKPFYQCTVAPKAASTDAYQTTTNQTTDATANGPRVTFNNAVRAGLAYPVAGYIELADNYESARDSGLWKAPLRSATDLNITTGTTAVTSTAQMQFTQADVGTGLVIAGAGAAGAVLSTFILAVTSPTACTVATAAGTTVTNAAGGLVYTRDGLHATSGANRQLEFSPRFSNVVSY